MTDTNNFVYLVMQHDPSMGKEWVMYAFDTAAEAEAQVNKVNQECGPDPAMHYFVKAIRYFKKLGGVDMKKFEVCVVSREYRYVNIEAENEQDAESKAYADIENILNLPASAGMGDVEVYVEGEVQDESRG